MNATRVRVFLAAATAAALGSGLVAACSGGDGGGTGPGPGPTTGSVVAQVGAGGAGVQGAQLSITGGGTAATGSNGQARFDNLQPGAYTVTLSQLPAGFGMGTETAGKAATVTAGGTANVSWSVQSAPAATATVTTSAASFSPSTVTIPAGGTVRFEYGSGVAHTVTPENPAGSWVERNLASASDNFSVTFTTPGTYRYRCRPHSTNFTTGMVGVITVQ
jgi:plastocyanin